MLEDLDFKIKIDHTESVTALQQIGKLKTGFQDMSKVAATAQFNLQNVGAALTTIAVASKPLAFIPGQLGVISQGFSMAATGAHHLAAAAGLVVGLFKYMYVGIGLLMAPLSGLAIIPKIIAGSFSLMFAVITAPFKIVISLVSAFTKGMMVLLRPVIAVAEAIFKFKLALSSLHLQFVLAGKMLSLLPPKIRGIVVGLVALGAAGRAGSMAMTLLTASARGAAIVLRPLLILFTAFRNPVAAAQMALMSLGRSLVFVSVTAVRATKAMIGFGLSMASGALSALKSMAGAAISAASAIGSRLIGAAKAGIVTFGLLAVAAVAWGAKTAVAAETSRVVFGTMLKDMEQGKALLQALQNSKVAALFDPKAIQDAGRDLFKAGVPVTQIIGKMEQLGQIAVATKTPIEDLSRIYRQGMARGAFQTDLVNQMAERGIDIYHALEQVTGKSGEALAKMMQDGKIGATEMNAAIAHMTTGTGIYAGAVENVSKTTAGMLAAIGNNVTQALGNMMGAGISGTSGLLQSAVAMTEGWKTSFVAMGPVVLQVVGVITDAFGAWLQFAGFVWTNIYGQGEATFGNLLQVGMNWATKFRWFFQNFGDIARFAFAQFKLFGVSAFNDFIYFFTDTLPAYLTWFSQNWKQVFVDAGNLIITVFSNIGTNIKNAMVQIWAFIKSGGTADLQFAFVPLLDGFKATVSELPNIPDRAMTELEKSLTTQIEGLGTTLADNFDKMQTDATAALNAIQPPTVELKDQAAPKEASTAAEASKKAVENKAAMVRSSEGQSFVSQFLAMKQKDQTEKKAQQATIDQAKDMAAIRREMEKGKPIAVRRLAHG